MKLRAIAIILLFALMFGVLSGCQTDESSGGSSSAENSESISENSTPADVPDESVSDNSETSGSAPDVDEPIVEETDFFTKNGHDILPQSAKIPDYCIETDIEHLYSCPIALPQAEGYSVCSNGEILYISYWQEENICTAYSIESGELIYGTSFPGWSVWGMLDNGGLWSIDLSSMEVKLFDREGIASTVREAAQSEAALTPQNAVLSGDGRYMLVTYVENASVTLYDLESGEEVAHDLSETVYFRSTEAVENGFLLIGFDNSTVWLDPASGTSESYCPESEISYYCDGLFSFYNESGILLGDAQPDTARFYMPLGGTESLSDLAYGFAAAQVYADNVGLNFYDLRNSKLISSLEFSYESYGTYCEIQDDGTAIIFEFSDYDPICYIYDLPSAVAENNATEVESIVGTVESIGAEIDGIASKLEEATGIDLLYASEGNDFIINDYVGKAELDVYTVYNSVKTVADILSKYPSGMLREAYENTHKGLRIYLCGSIYGTDPGSLGTAGGFTTEDDGYIIVAVDVNNNLEYDIPHELSHVFDRRINYVFAETGTDWMTIWESATPIADAYINTYLDYSLYVDYTPIVEQDPDNIWFVDAYSRAYATEDRARIMENLFNSNGDSIAEDLNYENLKQKARLYCYILRRCFPSCNNDTTHYWETHLGVIDDSVLP